MDITIFEIDDCLRPICVVPQREFWHLKALSDFATLSSLKMWCFDLAYVDRSSWNKYVTVFNDITKRNNSSLAVTELPLDEVFVFNNTVLKQIQENRVLHNREVDCIEEKDDEDS